MVEAVKISGLGKRFTLRTNDDYSLRHTLQQALKFRLRKKVPFWALRNIDLSISEGEVFGIIGANGSGKSTLLKILSKIVVPTTGRVELAGKVNSLLEVGTGFHPELTGRENVFLNGAILGLKKQEIKSKFDRIVEFSEVEKFLDSPVKHYSSGMFVRLAFAVAAHLDPDILIVDEVLSVGDEAFQRKCIEKMENEVLQGRTVILVTHNMQIIERLCDRVMFLQRGECLDVGHPKSVITHYLQTIQGKVHGAFESPEHRKGSGALRFTGVQVTDTKGIEIEVLPAGSHLIIRLEHLVTSEINSNVEMRIIFKTIDGQRISALSSSLQENIQSAILQKKFTEWHIPRFPLNKGLYTIDLEIFCNDILADLILDAYRLEVVAGSFYATGNLPASQYPILMDFTWQ